MRYQCFASLAKIAFFSLFVASCAKKTINTPSVPKNPTLSSISTCSKSSKGLCKKNATNGPIVNEIVPAPEVEEIEAIQDDEDSHDDSKSDDVAPPAAEIKNPIQTNIPEKNEIKQNPSDDFSNSVLDDFFTSYSYFQIYDHHTFRIGYVTLDTDGKSKLSFANNGDGTANYGGIVPEELMRFSIPVSSDVGSMGLDKFKVIVRNGNKDKICEKFEFKVAIDHVLPHIVLKENAPRDVFINLKKAHFCTYDIHDGKKKLASFDILLNKTFLDWCSPTSYPLSNAEKSALAISKLCEQSRKSPLNAAELDKLKSLKTLNLSSNVISDLSPLTGFIKLEELNLRRSSLKRVPQGIFYNLKELETLDLSENQITKIYPKNFIGLNNLIKLYLGNNLLDGIDEKPFDMLTSLKKISLISNKKLNLPENLFAKHNKLNKESLSEINFLKGKKINFVLKVCELDDTMCEENKDNEENIEYSTEDVASALSSKNKAFSEIQTINTWEITHQDKQFTNDDQTYIDLEYVKSPGIKDYFAIRNNKIYFCSLSKATGKVITNESYKLINFNRHNKSFGFAKADRGLELTLHYRNNSTDDLFSYSNLENITYNGEELEKLVDTITHTRKVNLEEFISFKDKCRIPFEVEDVLN